MKESHCEYFEESELSKDATYAYKANKRHNHDPQDIVEGSFYFPIFNQQ